MKKQPDWVITSLGKIVRRDKAKPTDIVPEVAFTGGTPESIIYNAFVDKESAYAARDAIIDANPSAFLPEQETKKKPGPMPRKNIVSQDDFRDLMRQELMERRELFWSNWAKLSARDKCDYYYKMISFAYSKAPTAKPLDDNAEQQKAERKRLEAAAAIAQGLPEVQDTDFEE